MSMAPDSVVVRVPASTSNCGSGFDTLGLALKLYNQVTLTPVGGAGAVPERPSDARAQVMVDEAVSSFAGATGRRGGFRYRIDGEVPPARGLGSSVTVIAGVLAGLDSLYGTAIGRHRLVALASEVEGHPDNASAGILGGFCVSRCDPATGTYRATVRFRVPAALAFVVASPELELLTKESRGALPAVLPYFDAVRSINSVAYFVAAFATGDYARLGDATGDFMHEPYRLPRIPGAAGAIAAGIAAGAYTGWLSGSGSSVLCLGDRTQAEATGQAMRRAFAQAGIKSKIRVLSADNHGLVVE